jgi:hypothetical protein
MFARHGDLTLIAAFAFSINNDPCETSCVLLALNKILVVSLPIPSGPGHGIAPTKSDVQVEQILSITV